MVLTFKADMKIAGGILLAGRGLAPGGASAGDISTQRALGAPE
jgi:hypothetical protein